MAVGAVRYFGQGIDQCPGAHARDAVPETPGPRQHRVEFVGADVELELARRQHVERPAGAAVFRSTTQERCDSGSARPSFGRSA
jgi:hypothetical protein